jgi:hypothetical protein
MLRLDMAYARETTPSGFTTRSSSCPCAWCLGDELVDPAKVRRKRRKKRKTLTGWITAEPVIAAERRRRATRIQ